MKTVNIKFQKKMLEEIDSSRKKHGLGSREEFISKAVCDKLSKLSREELIEKFMALQGTAKKKTTYEENRKTREKVCEELEKELGKRFR
jgi:metal-responsive CopG/Arc/MetJ family transcriptional regulator